MVSFSFDQSRVKLTLSYCCYGTGISKRHYIYHIGPDRVFFGEILGYILAYRPLLSLSGIKMVVLGAKKGFFEHPVRVKRAYKKVKLHEIRGANPGSAFCCVLDGPGLLI